MKDLTNLEGFDEWNEFYRTASDDWKDGWNQCKRVIGNYLALETCGAIRTQKRKNEVQALSDLERLIENENILEREYNEILWDEQHPTSAALKEEETSKSVKE